MALALAVCLALALVPRPTLAVTRMHCVMPEAVPVPVPRGETVGGVPGAAPIVRVDASVEEEERNLGGGPLTASAADPNSPPVRKVPVGIVVDMGRPLPPLRHTEFDCPDCVASR